MDGLILDPLPLNDLDFYYNEDEEWDGDTFSEQQWKQLQEAEKLEIKSSLEKKNPASKRKNAALNTHTALLSRLSDLENYTTSWSKMKHCYEKSGISPVEIYKDRLTIWRDGRKKFNELMIEKLDSAWDKKKNTFSLKLDNVNWCAKIVLLSD